MTTKRGKARKVNEVILDVEGAASLPGVSNLNPYAGGRVGTINREWLDHSFILGESHFKYLVKQYVKYYNTVKSLYRIERQIWAFWDDKGPLFLCALLEIGKRGQSPSLSQGRLEGSGARCNATTLQSRTNFSGFTSSRLTYSSPLLN